MKGSWATARMPNACARCTTSRPIRPRPTTPSVLPRSSIPTSRFFSQRFAFIWLSASAMDRADESSRAKACSATLMLLAPGALTTRIPRALAASRSTLSTPAPARPTTFRRTACRSRSPSTRVALLTMSPSASASAAASPPGGRSACASTVQPSCRNRSAAEVGSGSAITIFIGRSFRDGILYEFGRCRPHTAGRPRGRASRAAPRISVRPCPFCLPVDLVAPRWGAPPSYKYNGWPFARGRLQ